MTAPTMRRVERSASPYDPSIVRPSTPTVTGGVTRRLLERFVLIAFGLYHLPLFLNNYPSLGGGGFNDTGLAPRWGRVFTMPSLWVARTVFHVAAPGGATGDNGDTSEEFARLFLCVVVGAIGGVIWTIVDRRRPRGDWVESTTRVMLRYAIALGLLGYAIAKLLPQQFPPIAAATLERRVGDLSPMALLWTFMQYSRPYAVFGGLVELLACVLLCVRRTTTLGALVCLGVMTNVALLNYGYGVPVKLYATMLTFSAAVLVLYDARRLVDLLVRNRPVAASTESTVLQDRVPAGWRRVLKGAAVGSVALSSVVAMAGTLSGSAPSSPIDGVWRVSSSAPPASWRGITIGGLGLRVRTASDSTFGCRFGTAAGAHALALQCPGGQTGEVRWSRVGDTLRLQGAFDHLPVDLTATRVDPSSYTLMKARFHWVFD